MPALHHFYLNVFSSCRIPAGSVAVALLGLVYLSMAHADTSTRGTPEGEFRDELGDGLAMKLVIIPAGASTIADQKTSAESGATYGGKDEQMTGEHPLHEVTNSRPCVMGTDELRQAQSKGVTGTGSWATEIAEKIGSLQVRLQRCEDDPSVWSNSCEKTELWRQRSKMIGMTVGVPTEAPWGNGCRAGTSIVFSLEDGLSELRDHVGYCGKDEGFRKGDTQSVGKRNVNAWGLYDMHGSAFEFCIDWYGRKLYPRPRFIDAVNNKKMNLRALRSGAFHSVPVVSRSAKHDRPVGANHVRSSHAMRLVVAAAAEAKVNLKTHFKTIYDSFGKNSETKIEVLSGPKPVQMRNGRVAGKQWIAKSGEHQFKLTIEGATNADLKKLIERIAKLHSSYISACVAVSDEGEDGIAIYANLGGARAHGGKGYINLVPHADALVIAHEAGHTLEQVATQSDPKLLEKWEEAIKADNISVSDYGDTVRHEDLAEFAQVYAVCLDAGEEYLKELKKLSPKRYTLWEKILKPYNPEALWKTLDPFYKQHIVNGGLVVAGSEKVSLYALREAGYLANKMLANRPDVMQDLFDKRNMFVAVMAYCELQTDLPDCRGMSLWWAYRARGLGSRPVSCGEENLLDLKGDPYKGENIFIHEFAHGIHSVLGEEFNVRLRELYDQAKESGRFGGYAIDGGVGEFWAEGVQTWFECNGRKRPKSGRGSDSFTVLDSEGELVCHLTTREQLKTYCPELARLLDNTFRQNEWVYVPVRQRLNQPHLSGFDPNDAPEFRWPPAVIEAYERIEAENARKEELRKARSQR